MSAVMKADRQRAIRELVARGSAGSQQSSPRRRGRGFTVTQATVSRDVAELGLVKVVRGDRHVYLAPEDLAPPLGAATNDERLRRILADIPVRIGRSGLTLLLVGSPGSARVLGQAVDESSFDEQEGTLAGDNTLLVLFADEARLEHWLARFRSLRAGGGDNALPAITPSPAALPPRHSPSLTPR
jgi:transcriptional regulator of arginine metabolism